MLPYAIFLPKRTIALIISDASNAILESLVAKCSPCPSALSSHAVLFTCIRHATKLSDWLPKSYDVFYPHKRQKKLNFIQLSSEQNGTDNFPVHMTLAHAYAFSVPFLSTENFRKVEIHLYVSLKKLPSILFKLPEPTTTQTAGGKSEQVGQSESTKALSH